MQVQCTGNRRLEIERREDGNYLVKIILRRRNRDMPLANMVILKEEFEKMGRWIVSVAETGVG